MSWRFVLRLMAVNLLMLSCSAHAFCIFINGHSKQTVTVSPSSITRLPSATAPDLMTYTLSGADIAAAFGVAQSTAFMACNTSEKLVIGNSSYTPVGSGSNYLATNLTGIQLSAHGQTASVWTYPNSGANASLGITNTSVTANTITTGDNQTSGNIVINQKTEGKLTQGGTVNGGLLFSVTSSSGVEILDVYASSFTVTVPACTVNSYDKSVDLGLAYTNKLKAVGTTTNPVPFTINMTCANSALSPTVTFSADTDASNATVLKNTGSATGIGVQLLYGSSIITPGTAMPLGTVTSTAATDYSFTAQLFQLAETVTAGSIQSSATFTVDYE
ncbi:fimbrial protein [Enterobacteriaceae bacterium C23F]